MGARQQFGVFLNIPYDAEYEPLFLALISTVVAARMRPRCAVELAERGEGQLGRIFSILRQCRLSIHDLSRPDRFNMPFELGLAVALRLGAIQRRHGYILLTRWNFLAGALSDLKGISPIIHKDQPQRLIAGLAGNLGAPAPERIEQIHGSLMRVIPELKQRHRSRSVFDKPVFAEILSGAIELAGQSGRFTPPA